MISTLLSVRNVSKVFHSNGLFFRKKHTRGIQALRGVSLDLAQGEVLGIVGESGCGKTTLARIMLGLVPPTDGTVLVEGVDVRLQRGDANSSLRKHCRMVFQNLDAPLNPRMTVRQILMEPLVVHTRLPREDRARRVTQLLEDVHLPLSYLHEYPTALSGGEKRRLAVARAIAHPPRLIVADEPVASLDVSSRGQIISLLQELHHTMHMSMIVISHDIDFAVRMSKRLGIMFAGRFVEFANVDFQQRVTLKHPYSRELFASVVRIPDSDSPAGSDCWSESTTGSMQPLPQGGCMYRPRCTLYSEQRGPVICEHDEPALRKIGPGVQVACHFCEAC